MTDRRTTKNFRPTLRRARVGRSRCSHRRGMGTKAARAVGTVSDHWRRGGFNRFGNWTFRSNRNLARERRGFVRIGSGLLAVDISWRRSGLRTGDTGGNCSCRDGLHGRPLRSRPGRGHGNADRRNDRRNDHGDHSPSPFPAAHPRRKIRRRRFARTGWRIRGRGVEPLGMKPLTAVRANDRRTGLRVRPNRLTACHAKVQRRHFATPIHLHAQCPVLKTSSPVSAASRITISTSTVMPITYQR